MSFAHKISRAISLRRTPIEVINWRRLYALPTRHGLMAGLAVFGVFAISVRVQNNMLLLLSVALFVIFLLSVIWSAINLDKLTSYYLEDKVAICGAPSQLAFCLDGKARLYDVAVTIGKVKQITAIRTPHEMTFTPEQRGTHYPPPFLVETSFPFGLVRAWQWVTPPQIDVAPRPDFAHLASLMAGTPHLSGDEIDEEGQFNADSLESWVPGVPLSRISWKHYASKDRLLYKTGANLGQDLVRLHFDRLRHLAFEEALSVLCAGVLQASQQGFAFELQLPDSQNTRYQPQEIVAALRRLARCQAPSDSDTYEAAA